MPSLNNLTPKLIIKIFVHLSFADISKLRGMRICIVSTEVIKNLSPISNSNKNVDDSLIPFVEVSIILNEVARQRLNSAFLELGPRLITKYTEYLLLLKTANISSISSDIIFRGRLLRLLGSEHGILLALCRKHITNGKGCFSPGEILDLFLDLANRELSRVVVHHEENKKLARLVLLIDQYLDWFERFRMSSEKECSWYGPCVVDLLDSYLGSSYNLVVTHDGPLVKLSGRYVMKDQSEIPPKISEPLGSQITDRELLKVLQYIRKHVRWSNFIKSFRNDLENDVELEEDCAAEEVITAKTKNGYQKIYKKNQSSIINDYDESSESLIVMVNLQCHKSYGPGRLRGEGGFEEMNNWQRGIETINRDMKEKKTSLDHSLSIILKNDTNTTLKLKNLQQQSILEDALMETDESKMILDAEKNYAFNIEIKSIYRSNNSNSSEDKNFAETMLHVSHTKQHMFAAQTECNLY